MMGRHHGVRSAMRIAFVALVFVAAEHVGDAVAAA